MIAFVERQSSVFIETPEGVRFALHLAGPATRFLAWLVDALIIAAAGAALQRLVVVFAIVSPDLAVAAAAIAWFALSVGYGLVFEWLWRGQTPGKRVLQLRVVDATGLKLTVAQVTVRNLLRFADLLPAFYLVGGAAMFFGGRAQRLGDMAAGTLVIRHQRARPVDASRLTQGKYNSFLDHSHLAARLRQQVSPALVEIALQAVIRRDELEPAARIEIFETLADGFRKWVAFPEETTVYLTAEQYVRNALEIALNTRR